MCRAKIDILAPQHRFDIFSINHFSLDGQQGRAEQSRQGGAVQSRGEQGRVGWLAGWSEQGRAGQGEGKAAHGMGAPGESARPARPVDSR